MEFCERCRGIIIVQDDKAVCPGCGYRPKKKPSIKTSEKIEDTETVAVVRDSDEIHPIVDMKCPKCKNKRAYFWSQQTRAADESETKFYKCTKCKYTWRIYR